MHKSVFSNSPITLESLEPAKSLNLNSIFILSENLFETSINTLHSVLGNSVEIYASLTCFNSEDLLKKFPDSKPVEAAGKETLNGLCPTHEGVRLEIIQRAKDLLNLNIQGLWLNHIRYPTEWEIPEPNILDTCYCEHCLKKFSEYLGEEVVGKDLEEKVLLIDGSYYIEWIEFKSQQITSIVKEIRELITSSGKTVKLGIFVIPWEDKEYGAAIKRIIAQDFAALIPLVDVLSPGLYHKMCGKEAEWIKDKVNYFWETGVPQLPLIQSAYESSAYSAEEFKKALDYASVSPSIGVCIFTLEDLISEPDKFKLTMS